MGLLFLIPNVGYAVRTFFGGKRYAQRTLQSSPSAPADSLQIRVASWSAKLALSVNLVSCKTSFALHGDKLNGIVRRERRLIQSFLKNRLNADALNIFLTRQS
jgi:hypothetical protein